VWSNLGFHCSWSSCIQDGYGISLSLSTRYVLINAATGHDAVAVSSAYDDSPLGEKAALETQGGMFDSTSEELPLDDEGHEAQHPTEEEKNTLRRVAGSLPMVTYWLCAVEFAERASFYGVKPLFNNYVNLPLPKGGNGYGAPPHPEVSDHKPGALGLGTVKSSAVAQSFSMLVYALPVFFGWLADTRTGRYSLICWGVAICGVAHVIMVASGAPALLANHTSSAPFFISVYVLALGAGRLVSSPCAKSLTHFS
jgi:hypothetical protein